MRFRPALLVALGVPALLLAIVGASGQQGDNTPIEPQKKKAAPQKDDKVIEQSFPPKGPMETAWKVTWETKGSYGLIIKNAFFKRSPDHDWMQVLNDARISELLVPYHPGEPRFWDVSYNFDLCTLGKADAGDHGKLHVGSTGSNTAPCMVEELRERGVIWKSNEGVRRGHTLVLWGCLEAANYRYIIEYGFQDDGCITFRLGSTGRNYGGKEYVPHMHNALWRIDVDLDGAANNRALLMEHLEPAGAKIEAKTVHKKFNNGKEGGADFDAKKFTMLRIINTTKKNARGEYYSYDLMPSRSGNSRHFGEEEGCTQHDFWVTKYNPKDPELDYRQLPKYCNGESIENTDIVIWYSAPMHHEPRSEDGVIVDGSLVGCTHVGWSSFTLRPSNIYDRTPLFPVK